MARSFRIHKKDGTKVAEGESPLSITGVPPNTSVASGDYYAIAVEYTGSEKLGKVTINDLQPNELYKLATEDSDYSPAYEDVFQ